MSGLVLKLGPQERVLINGAVIENCDRRARFAILTPGVNVLRLREAIHPHEATTPVSRMCFTAQMILSGDLKLPEVEDQLLLGIEQLRTIFRDYDSQMCLDRAATSLGEGQPYQALRALRMLLPKEARLLCAYPK